MTDNESSLNKQQNIKPTDLKLEPWLRKRLEERAHPIDLQRSNTGKTDLLSSGSRRLLQFGQASTGLARSAVKHTGLSSLLSRAGNLTFLSRASRNIAEQSVIAESPYTYPIIDLPWFSPEQDITQNDIDRIGLGHQGETTSKTAARSTHPLSSPLSESNKEKIIIRHEKKPDTYINRLISPPIIRKIATDISNRTINKASEKAPSVQTRQMAASTYPVVPNKTSEIRNTRSSDRKPEIAVSKSIISTKSEPDTGKLKSLPSNMSANKNIGSKNNDNSEKLPIERGSRMTNETDRESKDVYLIPSSKPGEMSSSLIKNPQDKPTETVKSSSKDAPKTLNHAFSPAKPDTGKKMVIDSYDRQASIEMEHAATAAEKQQISKSASPRKNNPEKAVSQTYPAQELVHRKPLSVGKRIVQSLPIIRNIARKDERIPKIPTSNTDKLPDQGDTKLYSKQTDMVHPVEGSANTVPENDKFINFSGTDKTNAESHLSIAESKEVSYEIPTTETLHLTTSHDSESQIMRERTYQSYPVEESVQRNPLPIGQRSMRILPLAGSVSSEISQPSDDIFSLGAKLFESEVIPAQKNYDNPYSPLSSLPVTSPVHTDANTTGRGESSVSREIAMPGNFAQFLGRRLDLTLAPITPTTIARQQSDNTQTGAVTQYLQRLETSTSSESSSQSVTQTSPQQSQMQSTIQESSTRITESSMNTNPYKPDIKALAREIYPLIRRMIIIERERRPSR